MHNISKWLYAVVALGMLQSVTLTTRAQTPDGWKAEFKVQPAAAQPGNNMLQIKVINEWTNRLIGDHADPDKKVLDAYIKPFGGRHICWYPD